VSSDLKSQFDSLLESFLEWFSCVRNPRATGIVILAQRGGEAPKVASALRLWGVSFFLVVVLQIPALRLAGVEWNDPAYHLPGLLSTLLIFVGGTTLIHLGLKWHGVPSQWATTLVLVTTNVNVFTPLMLPLYYTFWIEVPQLIGSLKAADVGFWTIYLQIVGVLQPTETNHSRALANVEAVLLPARTLFLAWLFVRFSGAAAEFYRVDRSRVILASGFAMAATTLGLIAVVLIVSFLLFTAVGA
jgi:hypothetical protein